MYRLDSIDLGTYRGDNFMLVGYVEPAPADGEAYDPDSDAENYGWSLVREAASPVDDNEEIVRMDTNHGRPHLDREYLPPDSETDEKVWLEPDYSYRRMREYLLDHHRRFADLYSYYNE